MTPNPTSFYRNLHQLKHRPSGMDPDKEAREQLQAAVRTRDCREVQRIMRAHPQLAAECNPLGHTPLMRALTYGLTEVAEAMLDLRQDPNLSTTLGINPLLTHAIDSQPEFIGALARAGIDINAAGSEGHTALMYAATLRKPLALQVLLAQQGIDINRASALGVTALIIAAEYGNAEIIETLLASEEIDVNHASRKNETALMAAAGRGHAGAVAALLKCRRIDLNRLTPAGETAFMMAATYGHLQVIGVMLAHGGVDLNRTNHEGATAVMLAAHHGHTSSVEALLAHGGIDINQATKTGATALMIAAHQGHTEVVKALLKCKGIDINRRTEAGLTALMVAAKNGHADTVAVLLAREEIDVVYADRNGISALVLAVISRQLRTAIQVLSKYPEWEAVLDATLESLNEKSIASQPGYPVLLAAFLSVCPKEQVALLQGHLATVFAMEAGQPQPIPEVLKRLASALPTPEIAGLLQTELDRKTVSPPAIAALADAVTEFPEELAGRAFMALSATGHEYRALLEKLAAQLRDSTIAKLAAEIRKGGIHAKTQIALDVLTARWASGNKSLLENLKDSLSSHYLHSLERSIDPRIEKRRIALETDLDGVDKFHLKLYRFWERTREPAPDEIRPSLAREISTREYSEPMDMWSDEGGPEFGQHWEPSLTGPTSHEPSKHHAPDMSIVKAGDDYSMKPVVEIIEALNRLLKDRWNPRFGEELQQIDSRYWAALQAIGLGRNSTSLRTLEMNEKERELERDIRSRLRNLERRIAGPGK